MHGCNLAKASLTLKLFCLDCILSNRSLKLKNRGILKRYNKVLETKRKIFYLEQLLKSKEDIIILGGKRGAFSFPPSNIVLFILNLSEFCGEFSFERMGF